MKAELYLTAQSLRLPDDVRYAFLCGVMASSYGADRVTTVDPRITPRSIVIYGTGEMPSGESDATEARRRAEEAARLTARGRVSSLPSVKRRNGDQRRRDSQLPRSKWPAASVD